MQVRNKLIAALLCAVVPAFEAAAADAGTDTGNEPMEIMVVTPRVKQPLSQSLSSTTVISAEDIRNAQAPDVPTILRDVAGVEVSQPGGIGKPASLFLRGTNSNHVLVLVDGVRVNSATTGTTSIDQLMPDQIDHIEVARGNLSSLYGSEAIGGVVQIFTKKGHGAPAANVSAGFGNQGTRKAAAGFGGSSDATDFNLQLSTFKTDGVSALNPAINPGANPDRDGYRNNSLSANVGHAFNADHRLSATVFGSIGNNQYDSAFGLPTDVNTNREQMWKYSLASEDQLSEAWHSKVQVANGVDQYRDFLNGAPVPFGSLFATTSNQLTWENTLKLDDSKQLLLGAEGLRQKVSSDISPGYLQDTRRINSVFGGYTGRYGAHQMQLNLRQDNYSQYGGETTGLVGYGYALTDTWRATASYSTAFRAPTFNELYYPNYGNPALKPERSRNFEAGLRYYAAGGQQFDLVYFDNRIRDLINSVLVNPATFAYLAENVNEARITGAELSYAAHLGDTGVKAALTAQNPRDAVTGVQLDRRARVHSSLALTQPVGAWQFGGEWLYSGKRPDSGNTQTLAAYNVLNLTAGYAVSKDTRLSLRLDNITNQNDSSAYGYNPLGRRWFVAFNYQP